MIRQSLCRLAVAALAVWAFTQADAFGEEKTPGLFVVGDSISMQYGPFLEQYLAGTMTYARKSEDDPVLKTLEPKQGANGGDSSAVRAYVEAKEKAGGFGADVLMLNCGLHDIKKNPDTGVNQVPIELYEDNLNAILDAAERMQIDVVWVRTTPVDDEQHNSRSKGFTRSAADVAAYNAVADGIMEKRSVPVIDLHAFTMNLGLAPAELFADHVHYPVPVREKQAAFIAGALGVLIRI